MVYRVSPSAVIPQFTVGGVAAEKYAGVTFQAQNTAPFEEHYRTRAQAARYSGHCIMGLQEDWAADSSSV